MLQVSFGCIDQCFLGLVSRHPLSIWKGILQKAKQAMIFINFILEKNITCPLQAFYFSYRPYCLSFRIKNLHLKEDIPSADSGDYVQL